MSLIDQWSLLENIAQIIAFGLVAQLVLKKLKIDSLVLTRTAGFGLFFFPLILLSCNQNNSVNQVNLPSNQKPAAHNYYIDAENGSNKNSGLSPKKAWSSLEKVNKHTFHPGDSILFKKGEIFPGQLVIRGSGSDDKFVVIDSYGKGGSPRLIGDQNALNTIYLYNISYIQINHLDISNDYIPKDNRRTAIMVESNNRISKGFKFNQLDIHNVGGTRKLEGYGIKYESFGNGDAGIDGLLVQDCEIHDGMFTGVIGGKGSGWRQNWAKNVVVRNNYIHDLGKNGVRILNSFGALVEFNKIDNTGVGHVESASSVWVFGSDNTTFQFNELSHAHLNDGNDGTGMHADYACRNTLFQYNYSHDNKGGAFNVVTNGKWSGLNENPVFRYNLSVNDGGGKKSRTFHIGGTSTGGAIYNNTVYVSLIKDHTFISPNNWNGNPKSMKIYNNIFYVVNNGYTCTAEYDHAIDFIIDNNIWVGSFTKILDQKTDYRFDPELKNVGTYLADDYRLTADSPARDMGIRFDGKPDSIDYFGNAIKDPPDIGFNEFTEDHSAALFDGQPGSDRPMVRLPNKKAKFLVFNRGKEITVKFRQNLPSSNVSLLDVTGKIILKRKVNKIHKWQWLKLVKETLKNGLYFVVYQSPGVVQTKSIII